MHPRAGSISSPSRRSLHLTRAARYPATPNSKGKAGANAPPKGRLGTTWTTPETHELVRLLSNHVAAGNNNLKEETFDRVANELNSNFPSQRVPKTSASCRSKWAKLQAEFAVVSDIRSVPGFHYDDINGAVIHDNTRVAWKQFCASHPGAAKFENNPWPYWDNVSSFMLTSNNGHLSGDPSQQMARKGSPLATTVHATQSLVTAGPSRTQAQADPVDSIVITPAPSFNTNADATMGLDDHNVAPRTSMGPAATDPNSNPPPTPSVYLSRSASKVSSAMTSISQAKRSIVYSNAGSERSTTQLNLLSIAQQHITVVQMIVDLLERIPPSAYQSVLPPLLPQLRILCPPNPHPTDDDYIQRAVEALVSSNLDSSDTVDLANYMCEAQNQPKVKAFVKFDTASRKAWLDNALAEIQIRKETKAQAKAQMMSQ